MTRLFAAIGLLAAIGMSVVLAPVPREANAAWARYSLSDLVTQSDLIVTGSLIGRGNIEIGSQNVTLSLGVIRIDSVLKGVRNRTVVFLNLPPRTGFSVAAMIDHRDGQSGLWYLRLRKSDTRGIYAADHPQRFVPMDSAAAQIEAIERIVKR